MEKLKEVMAIRMIEKLKNQVGTLSSELAEAQVKAEMYRDTLIAKEEELKQLKQHGNKKDKLTKEPK
jgi:hypothetical protein